MLRIDASNLSQAELLAGEVARAVATAEQSVAYADRSGDEFHMMGSRAGHADVLHTAGQREESERLFADAELRQKDRQADYPLLYSVQGFFIAICCWSGRVGYRARSGEPDSGLGQAA